MTLLPSDLHATIENSMPIACVDFVDFREKAGRREVGLILRESPFGRVWCHLGGRVLRGESISSALRRHARDTLEVALDLVDDPQPAYVYQWFPAALAPPDVRVGLDPRKHAIGLSFTTTYVGAVKPRNEALDFAYHPADDLPRSTWPGTPYLIERLAQSLS